MKCHQVLTGACNAGDQCSAVGSVEGVPFTAYAAGCNIVILANSFERVQVIPGVCHDNIQISCVDCSMDTGKIAAAYGKRVCIFEPTPTSDKHTHFLDYRWIQTGIVEASCYINTLSWNLEGTRILTAGELLQMWAGPQIQNSGKVTFDLGEESKSEPDWGWKTVWEVHTSSTTTHLAFSPDGTLFATCSSSDRLVKVWYDNKLIISPSKVQENSSGSTAENTRKDCSYGYIYLPHPTAVTGFSWRVTSKYMPKGSVSNLLVTSCRDNICRIWAETILPDDGLVSLNHLDPVAAQNPRFRMHRHKHRFVQRLKHIKHNFHLLHHDRNGPSSGSNAGRSTAETLKSIPSSYSVHDFHMYGIHGSGITPGFHFHLAGTINAETDIPLVPSINGVSGGSEKEQNFVIHWLNNKEIHFTSEAEKILIEASKQALDKDFAPMDSEHCPPYGGDVQDAGRPKHTIPKLGGTFYPSHVMLRGKSFDEDDSLKSSVYPNLSAATSSTSISTDATMATTTFGDVLDRKIETLLRDWYQMPDMLFSIHPIDGSLLVWNVEFLDGHQLCFRQAQVSFCARIPNALPLGDAMTMSPNLTIYNGSTPFFLRALIRLEIQEEERIKTKNQSRLSFSTNSDGLDAINSQQANFLCLTTKHSNGSLNLWHLTVTEDSKFTQVLNISHHSRVCGHRFQLNDIKCHPILPLLLSTSHHNKLPPSTPDVGGSYPGTMPSDDAPLICIQDTKYKDWSSELILWRVDAVSPLCKSGGVTELSRINSPQFSAFSNAAWIPTLLPSTTLGSVSNSPSACFVASDGDCLRVYQALIDGRALLSEISTAERKKRQIESTMSLSTDSSLQGEKGQVCLSDIFHVVSEQSTARPGCILELDSIIDATNDWQNTQFLHVFEEALVRGEKAFVRGPVVDQSDLHSKSVFDEPFYVILIEKITSGSMIHMWHLSISSQHQFNEHIIDEDKDEGTLETPQNEGIGHTESTPIIVKTEKIYNGLFPLPYGVTIIHSCPAAGHLSSASIYPACYTPYLLVTACSDNTLRFWNCQISGEGSDVAAKWQEWDMITKDRKSAIKIAGRPLYVNAAYSGRVAVAYQTPGKQSCMLNYPDGSKHFECSLAVYECESTGGSEWLLCDTIKIRDRVSPNDFSNGDVDIDNLTQMALNRCNSRLPQVFSHDNLINYESSNDHPGASALHTVASQFSIPSQSTIQSLHMSPCIRSNFSLKQKHPVQLDWLSMEDGSYLLTAAIGSKVYIYSSVSKEVHDESANVSTLNERKVRPIMQKSMSLQNISLDEVEPRWLCLEKLSLSTADGLFPLPMRVSWVRDGILVIGMDNEMHIYSQWKDPQNSSNFDEAAATDENSSPINEQKFVPTQLQQNILKGSITNLKSVASVARTTSYSVLYALDSKMKKGLGEVLEHPTEEVDEFGSSGLYDLSQMVSPILPQYHPRQLNELLNSGKIRRVKAILGHLLRCLLVLGQSSSGATTRASLTEFDETKKWARSRTLSGVTPQLGLGHDIGRGSISVLPEELVLDYIEVKAIPPLPLWLLLAADKEKGPQQNASSQNKQETYAELFGGPTNSLDTDDDLNLYEDEADQSLNRRKSLTSEKKGLTFFGPRETQGLAALLTHAQLPGLSSLDQMHLLALADTVSSCDVDFADRFDINKAKEAMAKETFSRSQTDEPSMESLDDCGLRFLLAMRHHLYLLRCLPLGQRATLQKAGIGSHNIVWAFHSESQEELLNFIPAVRHGNIRWSELRENGVGWWVRSNSLLVTVILKVAKAAFTFKSDPLDAAIYYLAMKKKNLVWGLFRSLNDKRMTAFFSNNFAEDRWRKAALKNAFALMGKQRFAHAASFFLLAGSLKDAVEVVLNKLQDCQLAFVICRLYEGELDIMPQSLQTILKSNFLGCNGTSEEQKIRKMHPDPFIRSIAFWQLKDYNNSLNTLLRSDSSTGIEHPEFNKNVQKGKTLHTADPDVFNFYIYLRTHPLLLRQCIANSTIESAGAFMASNLTIGLGQNVHNVKSAYESSMSSQERCLYFTTAYAHLNSGCPALALEVLSKLPTNVIDVDNNDIGERATVRKEKPHGSELIRSGTIDYDASFEKSQNKDKKDSLAFDWSAPVSSFGSKSDELELDFSMDDPIEEEDEDIDTLETENGNEKQDDEKQKETSGGGENLDIMAQQLKFISCLKIMMEELATLATGCEVDGGQLRYQLYIWLEREVEALEEICHYRSSFSESNELSDNVSYIRTPSPAMEELSPSLHEILRQEKIEFESKMIRASHRKTWLTDNQQLLHTLLSYCSLYGSSGGGLASVRMELILLLQELQQEHKQQLLSPLPFPTTLPLLSASVASNKTVVVDPVRHLQCCSNDLLQTLIEIACLAQPDGHLITQSIVLRNLSAALSACIYQSLCDSENIPMKTQPRVATMGLDPETITIPQKKSTLLYHESKSPLLDEESHQVTTQPSKWPGVSALVALIAREKDEDTPRLNVLMCESFIAIYLCMLIHGIATCNAYVLYRLVSISFTEKDWAALFGGGTKKLLKVPETMASNIAQQQAKADEAASGADGILSTISSLQKTRMKLNMKLLGQLGLQDARTSSTDGDVKTAYREHFVPPEMSIVSYLMMKPSITSEIDSVDYDSSASDDEEEDFDEEEDEDVFKEPKVYVDNIEHCNPDSYSWCILRLACIRKAKGILSNFLQIAEIELGELPIQSPLIHSILRTIRTWDASLVYHMEDKKGPPPEYIPGCFVEKAISGPAILKYKGLLESHNTPFDCKKRCVKPVERLWRCLVRSEHVQDIFVRYIFGRKRPIAETVVQPVESVVDDNDSNYGEMDDNEALSDPGLPESSQQDASEAGEKSESAATLLEPIKIIHKDQESVMSFCINKVNKNLLAISTMKEVQEVDISLLLEHPSWLTNECELDALILNKDPETIPNPNFLVVHTPMDKNIMDARGIDSSSVNLRGSPISMSSQSGRSNVVMTYKLEGTRRAESHPTLPLYLLGCQDGSVVVREWEHSATVSQPRPGGTFAKVSKVGFNLQGNKFGVIDGDGHLSLCHLGIKMHGNSAFYGIDCHNKHGNDFAFVGSSSLIATAGQSSDHRNVALWDTLMPQRKAQVVAWTCHESGASALCYAPQHQVLISAGKKGEVCIFDIRQKAFRHKFQAHESAVKCMTLDLTEDFFVTGSSDGDIKVWGLSIHNLVYNLPGEHSRTSLFKSSSQGVTKLHLDSTPISGIHSTRLFSCGADGSVKLRYLPEKDVNINMM